MPVLGIDSPFDTLRTLGKGGGINLPAFMASQTDGLWFDTTKTDRFFQETIGPTLADDVGEAMGLALDQRTWGGKTFAQLIASRPNLVNQFYIADGGTPPTPTTYNTSSGVGFVSRTDFSNQGVVRIDTVSSDAVYEVDIENLGTSSGILQLRNNSVGVITSIAAGNRVTRLVSGAGATLRIQCNTDAVFCNFVLHSCKLVPGNHALQATGTLKPTRQAAGAKFDGSDDHLLTPYKNGGAGDFIVALVNVPASVPSFGAFAGGRNAVDTRFFVGVAATGVICGGVGSTSTSVMIGTVDRRGQTVVAGLTCNGSTVRLFDDTLMPYEAAQAGSIDTTVALRIGTFSEAGGPATSYFNGSIQKIIVGREFLTLDKYLQIRNALLAA